MSDRNDFNAEQAALWRYVEHLWDLSAGRDVAPIREALHPDYAGCDTSAPAPHDREAAVSAVLGDAPRLVDRVLHPLSVRVYDGAFGVVH